MKYTNPETRHVRIVVVAAVTFVSFSAILVRLSAAPPLAIAAWRMGISTVMMGPILLVARKRGENTGKGAAAYGGAENSSAPLLHVLAVILVSGFLLAIHFAAWITSLSLTSVTHSTVLVTLHPMIVIGASALLLRERVSPRALYGALGAIAGAILLSFGGTVSGIEPTLRGNALAFLGALTIAGYMVLGRWVRRYRSAAVYNVLVYGSAAAMLLLIAFGTGQSLGPFALREYLIFAALAFFCTILGHGLFNWALRYVPATEISLAVLMEPVFASLLAVVVFREVPGGMTVTGALIILGSLFMVLYYEGER